MAPESADSLHSTFGAAYWNCGAQGRELTWRSSHTLSGEEVSPVRYGQFQQFLDAMEMKDRREIEVGKIDR